MPIIKYWSLSMNGCKLKLGLFSIFFLFINSCSHSPKNPQLNSNWTPLSKAQRSKLISKNTRTQHEYNGLNLIYKASVTFLTPELLSDNLNLKSQYKLWTAEEAENNLSKQKLETADTAFFIVNIYTRNKKMNKLNLKASGWSTAILFENNSQILKGEAKLLDPLTDHTSVFYPYIDSWDKTYLVKFKVGTEKLFNTNHFTFQILSAEGMTTFKF